MKNMTRQFAAIIIALFITVLGFANAQAESGRWDSLSAAHAAMEGKHNVTYHPCRMLAHGMEGKEACIANKTLTYSQAVNFFNGLSTHDVYCGGVWVTWGEPMAEPQVEAAPIEPAPIQQESSNGFWSGAGSFLKDLTLSASSCLPYIFGNGNSNQNYGYQQQPFYQERIVRTNYVEVPQIQVTPVPVVQQPSKVVVKPVVYVNNTNTNTNNVGTPVSVITPTPVCTPVPTRVPTPTPCPTILPTPTPHPTGVPTILPTPTPVCTPVPHPYVGAPVGTVVYDTAGNPLGTVDKNGDLIPNGEKSAAQAKDSTLNKKAVVAGSVDKAGAKTQTLAQLTKQLDEAKAAKAAAKEAGQTVTPEMKSNVQALKAEVASKEAAKAARQADKQEASQQAQQPATSVIKHPERSDEERATRQAARQQEKANAAQQVQQPTMSPATQLALRQAGIAPASERRQSAVAQPAQSSNAQQQWNAGQAQRQQTRQAARAAGQQVPTFARPAGVAQPAQSSNAQQQWNAGQAQRQQARQAARAAGQQVPKFNRPPGVSGGGKKGR